MQLIKNSAADIESSEVAMTIRAGLDRRFLGYQLSELALTTTYCGLRIKTQDTSLITPQRLDYYRRCSLELPFRPYLHSFFF